MLILPQLKMAVLPLSPLVYSSIADKRQQFGSGIFKASQTGKELQSKKNHLPRPCLEGWISGIQGLANL